MRPFAATTAAGHNQGMDLALLLEEAVHQDYPAATLYLVATPIGNLADFSLRALAVLMRSDWVAAEDTRMARRLLDHFGLDKPCVAGHRHNERTVANTIIEGLGRSERIAYLSDAGTPAISDPGAKLVDSVLRAGFRVVPIPGASAAICALSAAGLAEGAFYFAGFLPPRAAQAERIARRLVELPAQIVLYEAPHRVLATVALLERVFGAERTIVIARELTKLHESIERMRLGEAGAWLSADPNRQRGEFVLILEGAPHTSDEMGRAAPVLQRLLACLPLSEAVALTVELTGASRKDVYARALAWKDLA
jgi:16S rRNA (cytidine1402-2'-O)-methyltransferase